MTSLEAGNDPPVGPYRNCPKIRIIAFQTMPPEAGQVHILRDDGRIQPRLRILRHTGS